MGETGRDDRWDAAADIAGHHGGPRCSTAVGRRSGYIHLASALNPTRSRGGKTRYRWETIADPESGYCDRTGIDCNRAGWVLEGSGVRARLIGDMVTAAGAAAGGGRRPTATGSTPLRCG